MLSGEDFGYLKDEEQNRLAIIVKRALLLGSVLFSIVCFVYITINAYYFAYHDNNNIKLIKSPAEPIKIVEKEGEGIEIKDIDKTIYDSIISNKKLSRENLNNVTIIDQAPTPLARTTLLKDFDKKPNEVETVVANQAKAFQEKEPRKSSGDIMVYDGNPSTNPSENKSGNSSNGKVNDASLVAPKKAQPQAQNQATTRIIEAEKPVKGLSRVQIAALTSKAAATDYWSKLSKENPRLFVNLNYFITEVKLGSKGTLYRLQIGNFKNQIEAENFCHKFISQAGKSKPNCIIVE